MARSWDGEEYNSSLYSFDQAYEVAGKLAVKSDEVRSGAGSGRGHVGTDDCVPRGNSGD